MDKLLYFIGVGFGSGLIKPAPGTWGSLAALVIGCFLQIPLWAIILLAIVGVYICGSAEKTIGRIDSPEIVFDEFIGMWIAMWSIPVYLYPVAFLLFRIFDISKIYPIGRLQEFHGGLGIMLDDIAAGIIARIVLAVMMIWI